MILMIHVKYSMGKEIQRIIFLRMLNIVPMLKL